MSSQTPRRLAGYRLIHRLGAGGMGEAWLAEREGDLGVKLSCVMKIVRPTSGDLENAQRRFIEEARMLSLLNHNNISRIIDVGSADGELYLAVEHVFGVDLQSMLRQLGQVRIPQPLVIHIVRELLSALEHTHALEHPTTGAPMNLVHRDVSPKNVMVTFDGAVKLIDFGIATSALHPRLTAIHEVVGTLAYMAPEQIRGERLDGRSDLYALGAMLYEMVLGVRYVKSSAGVDLARQLATGLFKPARMDELLPETAAVVRKATAFQLDERYADAASMYAALDAMVVTHSGEHAADRVLATFMRTHFGADRQRIRELVAKGAGDKTLPLPLSRDDSTASLEAVSGDALLSIASAETIRRDSEPLIKLAASATTISTVVPVARSLKGPPEASNSPKGPPEGRNSPKPTISMRSSGEGNSTLPTYDVVTALPLPPARRRWPLVVLAVAAAAGAMVVFASRPQEPAAAGVDAGLVTDGADTVVAVADAGLVIHDVGFPSLRGIDAGMPPAAAATDAGVAVIPVADDVAVVIKPSVPTPASQLRPPKRVVPAWPQDGTLGEIVAHLAKHCARLRCTATAKMGASASASATTAELRGLVSQAEQCARDCAQ